MPAGEKFNPIFKTYWTLLCSGTYKMKLHLLVIFQSIGYALRLTDFDHIK